jgi:hypothetical protein
MSAQNVVTLIPVAPFLLEFHSERLIDLMHALHESGFKVTCVAGSMNRYRVEDTQNEVENHGR